MAAAKPKSTVNRLLDLAKESELFLKNAEGDAYIGNNTKERVRARKDLFGLYHQKFDETPLAGEMNQALDILQSRVPPQPGRLLIFEGLSYLERLRLGEEIEPDPRWPKVVRVFPSGVPGITGITASNGFMAELHKDRRLIPVDDVLGDNGEIVYPAGKDLEIGDHRLSDDGGGARGEPMG